ncbi:hypothetical protein [Ruegeria arenilitoris]|uniref:hypothetical protein n=1 Tax=Ruegeria arenilitoris TaxID=1173585 RepID=UPI001480BDD4|nr:hypothetical protein [Ruegeria arenilitoris]
MKPNAFLVSIALMAISPTIGLAGNGKSKSKGFEVHRAVPQDGVIVAKSKHCPPGLAKKAVPCVPPGQVKNRYRVGDQIGSDYTWIEDPFRYGLDRRGNYVRAGNYVYRVDPDTQKVLNLIGAVADILY